MTRSLGFYSLFLIATLSLSACAQLHERPSHLTSIPKNNEHRFRTFTNVGPERILAAAKKVFQLMDKEDFEFRETSDNNSITLDAFRDWFAFLVIAMVGGTDHWTLRIEESGNDSTVGIYALRNSISDSGQRTISAVDGDYILFWQRLEYLLGIGDTWTTCETARSWDVEKLGYTVAGNGIACHFTTADSKPPERKVK